MKKWLFVPRRTAGASRDSLRCATVAVMLACGVLTVPATFAKDKEPPKASDDAKTADKGHKEEDINLPPFPPDKTVHQSISLDGHELKYDATVGSLPVLDEKGKTIASVMFTAYTVPGANRSAAEGIPRSASSATRDNRPVTFALNGGPGAASVYLNLGAIGWLARPTAAFASRVSRTTSRPAWEWR